MSNILIDRMHLLMMMGSLIFLRFLRKLIRTRKNSGSILFANNNMHETYLISLFMLNTLICSIPKFFFLQWQKHMLAMQVESIQNAGQNLTPKDFSEQVLGVSKRKGYLRGFGVGPKSFQSSSKSGAMSKARDEEVEKLRIELDEQNKECEREREEQQRKFEEQARKIEEQQRQFEEQQSQFEEHR